jgi:O-antigen/teichoic acid export membrane protein
LAFVIPALAVAAGLRLPGVVLWMAISRLAFTLAHGWCCLRVLPCLRARPSFHVHVLGPLLSFGGWVTASNIINPILLSMDRFLIGSLVSVAMVGYYTAPFEAVTKLWMIPASLMTTVYPACSALGPDRSRELQALYARSIRYILCALAPAAVFLTILARPIISAWLGPEFVRHSAVPLQFLAVGVFINSFAHVPYCFLQALGRPDTAAKLFLCELVPYGLFTWWMIERYGIAGAALAWAVRVLIEVLLLLGIAERVFSLSLARVFDRGMWMAIAALCGLGIVMYAANSALQTRFWIDLAACCLCVAAFGVVVWKWVLDGHDKVSAQAVVRPVALRLGLWVRSAQPE